MIKAEGRNLRNILTLLEPKGGEAQECRVWFLSQRKEREKKSRRRKEVGYKQKKLTCKLLQRDTEGVVFHTVHRRGSPTLHKHEWEVLIRGNNGRREEENLGFFFSKIVLDPLNLIFQRTQHQHVTGILHSCCWTWCLLTKHVCKQGKFIASWVQVWSDS